jgi:hypothetical protein
VIWRDQTCLTGRRRRRATSALNGSSPSSHLSNDGQGPKKFATSRRDRVGRPGHRENISSGCRAVVVDLAKLPQDCRTASSGSKPAMTTGFRKGMRDRNRALRGLPRHGLTFLVASSWLVGPRNESRHAGIDHCVEPDSGRDAITNLPHRVVRQGRDIKILLDMAWGCRRG